MRVVDAALAPALSERTSGLLGQFPSCRPRGLVLLLVSGLLGVSYILLVAIATSLGRGGALPPVLGAWGPLAVFTGLGGWLGLRLWRGM